MDPAHDIDDLRHPEARRDAAERVGIVRRELGTARQKIDGVARGGYRLVYNDTPTDFFKASETRRRITDLTYSLGVVIGREARITDVLWEGPAYKKGMTIGTQIIAVNGTAFDIDRLKRAVQDAKQNGAVIELLVKNGDRFRTIAFDYHDGLRYPHLERDGSGPARLDQILTARN